MLTNIQIKSNKSFRKKRKLWNNINLLIWYLDIIYDRVLNKTDSRTLIQIAEFYVNKNLQIPEKHEQK